MLHLLLQLGSFQVSDIVYNTLGGKLGGLCYVAAKKVCKKMSKREIV
jgi:glycopeptide antibiotics resistance protein